MKILSLMAQKGGAGKTTIGVHLAVLAEQMGKAVVLIDLDPQRSASSWWHSRKVDTPLMVETTAAQLADVIGAARTDNVDLVIIDTPPHTAAEANKAAELSDLILIPTRPAILDLRAISRTVDIVKSTNRPAVIVLNACQPGRGAEASVVREARMGLKDYGLPVAPVAITQRVALSHALIDGQAVTEFEPNGKAAHEIRALFHWLEENTK